jgi:hypothetical protein
MYVLVKTESSRPVKPTKVINMLRKKVLSYDMVEVYENGILQIEGQDYLVDYGRLRVKSLLPLKWNGQDSVLTLKYFLDISK